MQIPSLTNVSSTLPANQGISSNSSYEATTTIAESSKFESLLKDATRKIESKVQITDDEVTMKKKEKELKEACKGFEAMFLSMMYKSMRSTVPENSLFGESNAQKIFQDMYDQELMDNVADSNKFGIADLLYKQLAPQVLAKTSGTLGERS